MTQIELRVVFDTNVLISAALKPESRPRQALLAALSEGQMFMSVATFGELENVLNRTKFDVYLTLDERAYFLDWVHGLVTFVHDVPETVRLCSDPEDDKFLNLALSVGASHLVTGNVKDFPPESYGGVEIVTPARFADMFS